MKNSARKGTESQPAHKIEREFDTHFNEKQKRLNQCLLVDFLISVSPVTLIYSSHSLHHVSASNYSRPQVVLQ